MRPKPKGVDRSRWPLLVRVGLWGVSNREMGLVYAGLSLAVALGCLVYARVDGRFAAGAVLEVASFWYYFAIRWVDEHGGWS